MLLGLERPRGRQAPSLSRHTMSGLNARPDSSPDRATKNPAEAGFFVAMEGTLTSETKCSFVSKTKTYTFHISPNSQSDPEYFTPDILDFV